MPGRAGRTRVRLVAPKVRLELPTPPSLNNLFRSTKDGLRVASKRYGNWRRVAAQGLYLGYKRIEGPVSIKITVEDVGRRDLDNFCKAILDFLVAHRIILNDDRPTVREITMRWGNVKGVIVEIEAVANKGETGT